MGRIRKESQEMSESFQEEAAHTYAHLYVVYVPTTKKYKWLETFIKKIDFLFVITFILRSDKNL